MILPMRLPGARVGMHGELLGPTGLSSNMSLSYHKHHASPGLLLTYPAFLISEHRRATQKYIPTDFLGNISTEILETCIIVGMQSSN